MAGTQAHEHTKQSGNHDEQHNTKQAHTQTGHEAGHNSRNDKHSDNSQDEAARSNPDFNNADRSDNLQDSPTMSRLMDALNEGTDIGHYGQFTFVAVARHFLSEDEITDLLVKQPGMDEDRARALYIQIKEHDYNPPKRDKIIEQQAHQEFQIIENADDPDAGNLYRELRFPDGLYEHINHYYEDKAEAETHGGK